MEIRKKNKEFVIYKADGSIHKTGKTDAQGYTPSSYFEEPEQLTAHLKDDDKEG